MMTNKSLAYLAYHSFLA